MKKFIIWVVAALMASAPSQSFAASMILNKEAAHLERLNEARAANGLSKLSLSTELTEAAQVRAREIEVKWGHTRPNGSPAYTALADTSGWNGVSENIASGKGLETAYDAVDVLMSSSGHKANILAAAQKAVGVATYQADDGTYYWVELFAQVRPTRDADKVPQGNKNEPTWIQSVTDSSLTVDSGRAVSSSTKQMTDYYTGKQTGTLTDMIKKSQAGGRYTLVIIWSPFCPNTQLALLQAQAHGTNSSAKISQGKWSAQTDTSLPRLYDMDDVDIIAADYSNNYRGYMKSDIDTYWPNGATVWNNVSNVRSSTLDEALGQAYAAFFDVNGNPSEVLCFLYKGGKMIARSRGEHQSNTFDQWAKKIASLRGASTPETEQVVPAPSRPDVEFVPPKTPDEIRSVMNEAGSYDDVQKIDTAGANMLTFTNGEYSGLTNKDTETPMTFTAGQVIDQAISIFKTADALNAEHDGTELTMEIRRGERVLLRDRATLSGGTAVFSVKVDDIVTADGDSTRSAIVNAHNVDGCEMAVFDETHAIVDIKMPFSIMAKSSIASNGGNGGSCVTGGACFLLVAAYGLVSLDRKIRESRMHN